MSNLDYERAGWNENRFAACFGKATLIVFGLFFVAAPFLFRNVPSPWQFWLAALILLGLAVYWICKDKPVPTPEEELESLLIEASQKISAAGSLTRLVDQYRAKGADDLTFSRIRGAPRLLRERARNNIANGIVFSGVGLILGLGSMLMSMWKGIASESLLKYGFFGAGLGLGHIALGLRLKWSARRFRSSEKPPVACLPMEKPWPPVAFDNDAGELTQVTDPPKPQTQ
jgi:hypothetical protein